MSARRPGVPAFAPISRAMQLPGTESISLLELSPVQPVLDLSRSVEAGLAQQATFTAKEQVPGATFQRVDFDFRDPTDWFNINRRGEDLTPSATNVVPQDHEIRIISAGSRTGAAFVSLVYAFRSLIGQTEETYEAVFATDTAIDLGGGANVVVPRWIKPYPWIIPEENRDTRTFSVAVESSAGLDYWPSFTVIHAVPGVFGRT